MKQYANIRLVGWLLAPVVAALCVLSSDTLGWQYNTPWTTTQYYIEFTTNPLVVHTNEYDPNFFVNLWKYQIYTVSSGHTNVAFVSDGEVQNDYIPLPHYNVTGLSNCSSGIVILTNYTSPVIPLTTSAMVENDAYNTNTFGFEGWNEPPGAETWLGLGSNVFWPDYLDVTLTSASAADYPVDLYDAVSIVSGRTYIVQIQTPYANGYFGFTNVPYEVPSNNVPIWQNPVSGVVQTFNFPSQGAYTPFWTNFPANNTYSLYSNYDANLWGLPSFSVTLNNITNDYALTNFNFWVLYSVAYSTGTSIVYTVEPVNYWSSPGDWFGFSSARCYGHYLTVQTGSQFPVKVFDGIGYGGE